MRKKLPFSIEEYKKLDKPEVVTGTNLPVRILCTDNDNPNAPVVAMVSGSPHLFTKDGDCFIDSDKAITDGDSIRINNKVLIGKIFILGPEELNEWETAFQQVINDRISNGKLLNADDIKALIRTYQALSTFVPYDYEIEALQEAADILQQDYHSETAKELNTLLERIKKYV